MSTASDDRPASHHAESPLWHWLLAGFGAGAIAVGLAELLAGVFQRAGIAHGTPSPVYAVGSAFIDRTPPWLKNFAVQNFGTHDKQVLLASIAVVLLLLSLVIGWLLRRWATVAFLVFAALVAVALAAVLTRANSGAADAIPMLAGGFVGLLVLSKSRNWLVGQHNSPNGPDRRKVVLFGGAAAVVGALGIAIGRLSAGLTQSIDAARKSFVMPTVASTVTVPADASVGVKGVVPFVVPNDQFYRIDTALAVPQVDPSSWKLRVVGMVDREVEITWEQLQSKSMTEAMVTLMCVSNEVGGNLNGNAIWVGWPVRELLAQAGVQPGADMVLSKSVDGWTAGTPLEALTDNRNALIAIAMNGEALPVEHGFPARLVVPGLYGYVSATKWVTELKVTTYAKDMGYWTPRGWSPMGPVKTSSRIDVPTNGSRAKAGKIAVAGSAWDQHVGIREVQVQIDNGPWQQARLGADVTADAWRQWVYEWDAPRGSHTIKVRAVDATGQVQISTPADPAPNGASGLHTIHVTVA